MRTAILIALVIFGLAAVACTSETPSPADTQTASSPTPDVPATVEASILATRVGETAIDATVEATVAAALATSAPTPTPSAGSSAFVSAGGYHTCEVMGGGSVACWGSDYYGQATSPAGSFDSVSTGWDHTCGVRSDGSVACWGWNESGRSTPPAGSFTSVSAGGSHTCGIGSDGSVACWGSDAAGLSTPPSGSFISVSAGSHHTCGVKGDGSVACWGNDAAGQSRAPSGSFVSASAGGNHTCGLRRDGSVVCWGSNFDGEATPPAGSFVSVSAGNQHTCGLRSDGSVECWGSDENGQAAPPAGSFVSVSAGNLHTCGVRSDSSVACWGSDEYGQATPPAGSFSPTPAPTPKPKLITPTVAPTSAPTPVPTAAPTAIPTSTLEPTVIEHGNARAVATEIVVGEAIAGAIDYEDDVDFFRFTATAGELYQIDVALGTLDDSEATLRDSDGRRLASNDDHGESPASRIVWAAPDSGDYYVEVSGWVTGSYTLTISLSDIQDDHGDDTDSASAVAVGADTQGSLDYEDDVDFFRFTATAGELYQIDVALGTLDDSEATLRDSDGWGLASNDDHGDSLASRIVWATPDSGDYYVEVSGWVTGSYTLTISLSDIQDDHGDDTDSASAVAVGADTQGSLDYEDDVDFFRFTATAGQLYQIDVALGILDDSEATLRDSDGRRLASNDDHGDSLASRIVWAAPDSGDYYVEVGAAWGARDGTGSYTLTISLSDIQDDHGDDTDSASAIAVGADTQGSLDYEDDVDFFRFTATAGQLYQIDVALETLDDSEATLLNSDGWRLASNDDHGESPASRIVWAAPDSGDYYVEVGAAWGARDGTGSYTLTISLSDIQDEHGDDTDSASAIGVGADTQGSLDYEDDVDFFRFTATAGQLYQIDVALETLDDSEATLLNSDGWGLTYNDDHGEAPASRIVWAAPDSGDYYVEVGAAWGARDGTGSYTLTISLSDIQDDHGDDTDSASAIGVGADTQGALDYEGDVDFFRFTAAAGELYQIDVALGTLDDSEIILLDSDGRRLASNDDHGDSLASRIFWEAPDSGDYYVEVSGLGAGSYTLTVTFR